MRIARVMLNRGDLMRWSESELVFLIFVGGGVPTSYKRQTIIADDASHGAAWQRDRH